ncbi:MAG: MaoC/PaaZ C-terminal domain-containing protein [Candidatus Hodarchaeota archaeon]
MEYSGLNPAIVGRVYTGSKKTIDPDKILAYAQATNETNPKYFDQDKNKRVVPPLFPVTLFVDLGIKIVSDNTLNLDISRMVHGEHEILYHRPLQVWENVITSAELKSIDEKPSGDILWLRFDGHVSNELVFEMKVGLFFRKPRKEVKSIPKSATKIIKQEIILSKQILVTSDQSKRYSEASRDTNPIHLDKDFALSVGLPNIILHGLCTMAFATQAIVDGLANGDPTRVRRAKTRFSKPVFMNDILTTECWIEKDNELIRLIGFETRNQAEIVVLTQGEVELLKK